MAIEYWLVYGGIRDGRGGIDLKYNIKSFENVRLS